MSSNERVERLFQNFKMLPASEVERYTGVTIGDMLHDKYIRKYAVPQFDKDLSQFLVAVIGDGTQGGESYEAITHFITELMTFRWSKLPNAQLKEEMEGLNVPLAGVTREESIQSLNKRMRELLDAGTPFELIEKEASSVCFKDNQAVKAATYCGECTAGMGQVNQVTLYCRGCDVYVCMPCAILEHKSNKSGGRGRSSKCSIELKQPAKFKCDCNKTSKCGLAAARDGRRSTNIGGDSKEAAWSDLPGFYAGDDANQSTKVNYDKHYAKDGFTTILLLDLSINLYCLSEREMDKYIGEKKTETERKAAIAETNDKLAHQQATKMYEACLNFMAIMNKVGDALNISDNVGFILANGKRSSKDGRSKAPDGTLLMHSPNVQHKSLMDKIKMYTTNKLKVYDYKVLGHNAEAGQLTRRPLSEALMQALQTLRDQRDTHSAKRVDIKPRIILFSNGNLDHRDIASIKEVLDVRTPKDEGDMLLKDTFVLYIIGVLYNADRRPQHESNLNNIAKYAGGFYVPFDNNPAILALLGLEFIGAVLEIMHMQDELAGEVSSGSKKNTDLRTCSEHAWDILCCCFQNDDQKSVKNDGLKTSLLRNEYLDQLALTPDKKSSAQKKSSAHQSVEELKQISGKAGVLESRDHELIGKLLNETRENSKLLKLMNDSGASTQDKAVSGVFVVLLTGAFQSGPVALLLDDDIVSEAEPIVLYTIVLFIASSLLFICGHFLSQHYHKCACLRNNESRTRNIRWTFIILFFISFALSVFLTVKFISDFWVLGIAGQVFIVLVALSVVGFICYLLFYVGDPCQCCNVFYGWMSNKLGNEEDPDGQYFLRHAASHDESSDVVFNDLQSLYDNDDDANQRASFSEML